MRIRACERLCECLNERSCGLACVLRGLAKILASLHLAFAFASVGQASLFKAEFLASSCVFEYFCVD